MNKFSEPPEGIIITISAGMLKEKGLIAWTREFLHTMQTENWTYWMRVGARPTMDKYLLYVYLCIGNRIRYRALYAGSEGPGEKVFLNGTSLAARAWIILSGPVEKPPFPIEMKGFRGFRYTQKLF